MNKKICALICLSILFVSCKNDVNKNNVEENSSGVAFNTMLDDYYEEGLKLNPINATFAGDNRYNNSFPNTLSQEYTTKIKAYYTNYLEQLSQYSDDNLSESEQMSKAVLKWDCDINLQRLTFRQDLFPIDQMWTVNLMIGQLASGSSAQPFNTVGDYNNWLQRLDGYLEWMASAESKMKEGIESGYVLPKSLIKKVLPQLEALTLEDLDQHLFYSPVKNFPESFSEEDKKALTESYTKIIIEKVIPAYKSLHQFMSTDYMEAGRVTSGYEAVPNGQAYYAHQIKTYTTTNMTAAEIHQLGLDEVARILSEMEKVKS